jgi:hypothetical protein
MICETYFTMRQTIFHHEKWVLCFALTFFAAQNSFPHCEKPGDWHLRPRPGRREPPGRSSS